MESHLSQTRRVCVCLWILVSLAITLLCAENQLHILSHGCGGANEMETAVGTEISVTSIHSETLSFVPNPKVEKKRLKRKEEKSARETRPYYDSLRLRYFIVLGDFSFQFVYARRVW